MLKNYHQSSLLNNVVKVCLAICLTVLLPLLFSCQGEFDSKIIAKSGADASSGVSGPDVVPVANAIKGVTGVSDGVPDQFLSGSLNAIVSWDAFTGAQSYDVTIKDSAGTGTICPTINTTSLFYSFSTCALVDGTTYKVYVTGKSTSGTLVNDASNNGYSFTVDSSVLGAFLISGITGGGDTAIDSSLVDTILNTLNPTVHWTPSASADVYDVIIKDSADTVTLCTALGVVGTTSTPIACILSDGQIYRVHVTARRNSGASSLMAVNDAFYSFRIDNTLPNPFSITGVTGGSDATVDTWLSGGTNNPTINWAASGGAATYDILIKNNAGTVNQCSQFGVVGTSAALAGCGLATSATYRVFLTAKTSSGLNSMPATNTSAYSFTVDSVVPGAFTIAGVTGGGDVTQDAWLVNTLNPTVHFGTSTDSAGYDITIRNMADTVTQCTLTNQVASPIALAGCGLVNGTSYRLFVSSKNGF